MGEFIGQLVIWATGVVAAIGYPGVAFLIALEAVFPPIPSEVILPLAGSLSASGEFNFFLMVVAATIGSVIGASVLYSMGRWGGENRIGNWLDRYGKWILLSRTDLDRSREWFVRYGSLTVLICRFVPGMRTFVSVPAGLALMPWGRFLVFTAIGSAVWDGALLGAGYFLGKNWNQVEGWITPLGPIVYGFIFLLVAVFIGKRLWSKFGPAADRG